MKVYCNDDGKLHQVNGPAIDYDDGMFTWRYNGQMHRYYGPAGFYGTNEYFYWIFDEKIK